MSDFDVFIIGSGIAGLAAADEAAKRGLSVAIAEEAIFGGLVLNVNHLNPAPAGAPASGVDLATELMERIVDGGAEMLMSPVEAVVAGADGTLNVVTGEGIRSARAVVVASGARLRKLGIPGEEEFEHRGVSHCADCDASFFKGKPVVVAGGGDSALQEALVLAEVCSEVHIVHRGAALSARPDFVAAAQAAGAISLHLGTVIEALEGADALASARLRDVAGGKTHELPCSGFFPFIGLEPNSAFLPVSLLGEGGAVAVDGKLETGLANVFAIGAVRTGFGGLLEHAVADAKSVVRTVCERLGR